MFTQQSPRAIFALILFPPICFYILLKKKPIERWATIMFVAAMLVLPAHQARRPLVQSYVCGRGFYNIAPLT